MIQKAGNLFLIPFSALALATTAWAVDPFVELQARCGELEKAIQSAGNPSSDEVRMSELQKLKSHISMLKFSKLPKSKVPQSYWQMCLNKSIDLLRAHTNSASPSLRLNPNYLVLISEVYEIQDNLAMSVSFMDDAIKRAPEDYALRIRGVRIWLASEEKKANELPSGKSGAPGSNIAFKNRLESYLKPIIENRKAPVDSKLAALQLRAAFWEKTGAFDEAQKDWQNILTLDPKNIEYLRKIAALETSRGSIQKAISILNKIVTIEPSDLAAHKSLIKIYSDQKDFRSAKSQSRLALKYHPRDPELEGILRIDGGN